MAIASIGAIGGVTTGFAPAKAFGQARRATASDATTANTPEGRSATQSDQDTLKKLKARDAEVRRHEQAHIAAAGQYATGGPTFEYTTGPDGKRYATGGEVSIDVSPEKDPEATIRKMQVVRRAALAPAEPSNQDRQVAAQASQNETRARQELAKQRQSESGGESPKGSAVKLYDTTATAAPRVGFQQTA